MGDEDEERYVTMTVSVTPAQKAGVRRIARQRQTSDSVIVRDALRPLLAEDNARRDERDAVPA